MTDMSVYVLNVGRGNTVSQTISNMEKEESMNAGSVSLIKYKVKCVECEFEYVGIDEEKVYWAGHKHVKANNHIINMYMCIGEWE